MYTNISVQIKHKLGIQRQYGNVGVTIYFKTDMSHMGMDTILTFEV